MSRQRLFRILALDGGGLRGTFTAAVLAKWAEMLEKDIGVSLADHFDLIAGTSTGAILAIGLGLGHKPQEMLDFYRTKGSLIFPQNRELRHWVKSKHDAGTLKETLRSIFKSRTLANDSRCRLVIPTVRANQGDAVAIVTPHSRDRTAHAKITAVEAALATSAAPTYFDAAVVKDAVANQAFLDGGVWANNPTLVAVAEAVGYLEVPLSRIDVLNIGTMSAKVDFTRSLGKGKLSWAAQIADLCFAAQ